MQIQCMLGSNICCMNLNNSKNMDTNFEISCPCCGTKINVNDVLLPKIRNLCIMKMSVLGILVWIRLQSKYRSYWCRRQQLKDQIL